MRAGLIHKIEATAVEHRGRWQKTDVLLPEKYTLS